MRAQQGSIDQALEELPDSLRSLDRQRDDLITMLTALDDLSDVGVRVINRSKDVTIESLQQLQPLLTQLANSGDSLVDSFSVILTYPFVDEVVGRDPQVARNLKVGDFTNLSVRLDLDLTDLPELPGVPCTPLEEIPDDIPIGDILDLPNLCADAQDALTQCLNNPSAANCAGLPAALVTVVCDSLTLPLPVLCGRNGGGGGNGGGLPDIPGVPDLPDLPGGLGGQGGSADSAASSTGPARRPASTGRHRSTVVGRPTESS